MRTRTYGGVAAGAGPHGSVPASRFGSLVARPTSLQSRDTNLTTFDDVHHQLVAGEESHSDERFRLRRIDRDPAVGSVKLHAPIHSPEVSFGR